MADEERMWEEEEENWENWEDDEEEQPVVCPLSGTVFPNIKELFQSLKSGYGLDIQTVLASYESEYDRVKVVNFVRAQAKEGVEAVQKGLSERTFLEGETYLRPVLEGEDPLLLYALSMEGAGGNTADKVQEEEEGEKEENEREGGAIAALKDENLLLRQEVDRLREECLELIEKEAGARKARQVRPHAADEEKMKEEEKLSNEDKPYFRSYSHYMIHRVMLGDRVRTDAYRDAILNNSSIFEGKTVLDVGCGTGILSLFAAKAGAKQVIGVDRADIIGYAREIAMQNGFSDKITFIQGKVEEINLPVDKVDIIVSEWMGYFLVYESMLDTVLYARDKWLREGGYLLPDVSSFFFCALDDAAYSTEDALGFWKDVYGFDMTAMTANVRNEIELHCRDAEVKVVKAADVASTYQQLEPMDLYTTTVNTVEVNEKKITLKAMRKTAITAICSHFDVDFTFRQRSAENSSAAEQACKVNMTTSPEQTPTHWKQSVFPLPFDIAVEEGDDIEVTVSYRRAGQRSSRFLDITLSIETKRQGQTIFSKKTATYRMD